MKKLIIMGLLCLIFTITDQTVAANEYAAYQDIEFEHSGARLLEKYTKSMYDKYYKKISKKKFWGWSVYTAYKTEKAYFTKETLYVIYNEGTTPIVETFSFNTTESVKKQYNVSGTLGLTGQGDAMGFKLGLEEKLEYSITAVTNTVLEEDFSIKIQVDPNTKLFVEIKGEAKVSNGVAKYYRFWRSKKKGGWEVFLVTTEYYSIRKEFIDESKIPTA
jgi:hypothetical protein